MDVLEGLNFSLLYINLSAFYYYLGFTMNHIRLIYSVDSLFLYSHLNSVELLSDKKQKKRKKN